jgi:hypothetical protein
MYKANRAEDDDQQEIKQDIAPISDDAGDHRCLYLPLGTLECIQNGGENDEWRSTPR